METGYFPVTAIGIIRTDFESSSDMPIRPAFSDVVGRAIVKPEYVGGVISLDLFHISISSIGSIDPNPLN